MKNDLYAITCYPWIDGVQYEVSLYFNSPRSLPKASRYAEKLIKEEMKHQPNLSAQDIIDSITI